MQLRNKILFGVVLLLAAGCTPVSALTTITPEMGSSPVGSTAQTLTIEPGGDHLPAPDQTNQDLEPKTTAPPESTPAFTASSTPSKAPSAVSPSDTLAIRLGKIAAATPPRDYLGEPDFYSAKPDLKEFNCFTDTTESEQQACLKEAGLYYFQLYQDLPYMWGGNTPYSYSVATALKAAGDPFLNLRPIDIPPVEEDRFFAGYYQGRSGKPMKAGFDCSGFTFWIMAHAGQPDFVAGQCADPALAGKDYYRCDSPPQMQAGRVIPTVGEGRVPIRTILQYGVPGDLIFTEDHVMFYLGDGQVVQSVDAELIGGEYSVPPPDAWLQEWANLHPELKMVQRGGVNNTTLEHMGTSFWIRRYTILETR